MNSFKKFLFAVAILGIGYSATANASSLSAPTTTNHIVATKGDKKGDNKGDKGHKKHKGGKKKGGK